MDRRSDHDRRPDDDGHRAQLDRHRAHPGRARPARLPDAARRRGDQRAALDEHRRRPAPRPSAARRAAVRRLPRPRRSRSSRRPSCRARPSPRPTCGARAPSATGRRRRSPSRSAASCAAGERFVYAYYGGVDKTAHERGFGEFYDAELRSADRLVGDVLDALPPGAVLLVTADHGQVEVGDRIIEPDPRPARPGRPAVGRGPLPLVARPPRRRPTSWPRRPPSATRTSPGSSPASRSSTSTGSVPPSPRPSPPASATSPSSPFAPVSFFDPADSGPFELSAATAR